MTASDQTPLRMATAHEREISVMGIGSWVTDTIHHRIEPSTPWPPTINLSANSPKARHMTSYGLMTAPSSPEPAKVSPNSTAEVHDSEPGRSHASVRAPQTLSYLLPGNQFQEEFGTRVSQGSSCSGVINHCSRDSDSPALQMSPGADKRRTSTESLHSFGSASLYVHCEATPVMCYEQRVQWQMRPHEDPWSPWNMHDESLAKRIVDEYDRSYIGKR